MTAEEFRADVVVETVEANRVLMTVDNRGESRFGAVNGVFSIRSETAFPAPISLRLANARVIVRADSVAAVSDDGRAVVFGHGVVSAESVLPAKSQVSRFVGFELVRTYGDGKVIRAKANAAQPPKECQAGGPHSVSCGLTGCADDPKAPGCAASCAAGYESCCVCEDDATSCGCYKK